MTTIALGGGPTVEQRRSFAGLKDGSQVPGYGGYCPQLKYKIGHTYGDETHFLAQSYEHERTIPSISPDLTPKRPLNLPDSTGDNKYTKEMVPGYTGYVPRMPFKFGDTYRVDSDVCIDEHMTNVARTDRRVTGMRSEARSAPHLNATTFDPELRETLNFYRDTHPGRQTMQTSDKREPLEPPIPGYYGYVPRIYTTATGLGTRYNRMAKNGLELFHGEQMAHKAAQKQQITINSDPVAQRSQPSYVRRLYQNSGMIPKYTGYVPQRRFNFGQTYGDTTRSMEVCSHQMPSFGDYTKTRPRGVVTSLA